MDNQNYRRKYLAMGTTAFIVVALSLMFSFLLNKFYVIRGFFNTISGILTPVTYGLVMTFLCAPLYNRLFLFLRDLMMKRLKIKYGPARVVARFAATFVSILVLLTVVVGLFALLIPSLVMSVRDLIDAIPGSIHKLSNLLHPFLSMNQQLEEIVLGSYETYSGELAQWISDQILPFLNNYSSSVTSTVKSLTFGALRVVNFVKDFAIGVIIMAYLLNIKGLLGAQLTKSVYALMSIQRANFFIDECRYVKNVFSRFIVGKLIDSAIIGIICYIVCTILNLRYTLVISVIVGVTNIIPFFGPFIGAIPSTLILLLTDPFSALQFVIFIIILQQFDGNILGPKILGQTTGLSSFYVLFSILLFGGLWGIVGMVIGVPTFAVLYRWATRYVNNTLEKKKLSNRTKDYWNLKKIDESTGEIVQKLPGEDPMGDDIPEDLLES